MYLAGELGQTGDKYKRPYGSGECTLGLAQDDLGSAQTLNTSRAPTALPKHPSGPRPRAEGGRVSLSFGVLGYIRVFWSHLVTCYCTYGCSGLHNSLSVLCQVLAKGRKGRQFPGLTPKEEVAKFACESSHPIHQSPARNAGKLGLDNGFVQG